MVRNYLLLRRVANRAKVCEATVGRATLGVIQTRWVVLHVRINQNTFIAKTRLICFHKCVFWGGGNFQLCFGPTQQHMNILQRTDQTIPPQSIWLATTRSIQQPVVRVVFPVTQKLNGQSLAHIKGVPSSLIIVCRYVE